METTVTNKPLTKKCRKCKKILTLDMFHNNKNLKGGKFNVCKKCTNANKIRLKLIRAQKLGIKNYRQHTGALTHIKNFGEEIVTARNKLKHFTMIIPAVSRSGKTTLITYMINQIKHKYDLVVLFTQNVTAKVFDTDVWDLKIKREHSERVIKQLRFFQERAKSYLNILLVFDDSQNHKSKYKNYALTDLILNGRNQAFSTVVCTHSDKLINKDVRKNIKFVVLMSQTQPESVEANIKTFMRGFIKTPPGLTKQGQLEWLHEFLLNHTKDFQALIINYDAKGDDRLKTIKADKGIDEMIKPKPKPKPKAK